MEKSQVDKKKLRYAMADADITTIRLLAEKAGVAPGTVQSIASGKGFRSITLDAIAAALGVNPLSLLKTDDGGQ